MKWYKFDKTKGSKQKRPPVRKWVLVKMKPVYPNVPCSLAAGYMKNAAGDKQSPYFVVPGLALTDTIAWCDCLPDDFEYPREI